MVESSLENMQSHNELFVTVVECIYLIVPTHLSRYFAFNTIGLLLTSIQQALYYLHLIQQRNSRLTLLELIVLMNC
jgi:hypothetical protein